MRFLPRSDDERLQAMQAASDRAIGVDPGDLAYSAETKAKLDAKLPLFRTVLNQRGMALAAQSAATGALRERSNTLRLLVSHFFQNLNFGIERGVFSASDRAVYQMNLTQTALPPMATQAELIASSGWAVSGEAARTAGGGFAIPFPTAAEIATARTEMLALASEASNKKDALDHAQETVAKMRADVDAVIRDIWDEVEFTFRRDAAPSLRRKARQYGVVYITRPGEAPEEPPEDDSPAAGDSARGANGLASETATSPESPSSIDDQQP
jgi:hypothetical protein